MLGTRREREQIREHLRKVAPVAGAVGSPGGGIPASLVSGIAVTSGVTSLVPLQLLHNRQPDKLAPVASGRVCSSKRSPVSGAMANEFINLLDDLNRYGHDQSCNRFPVKFASESHAEYLACDDLQTSTRARTRVHVLKTARIVSIRPNTRARARAYCSTWPTIAGLPASPGRGVPGLPRKTSLIWGNRTRRR